MKRLVFLAIVIASLLLIQSLIRSIYTLWQKQALLVEAQKELEAQKRENQDIKHKLELAQTSGFIEQEARNKLFLLKPGESSVMIDKLAMLRIIEKKTKQQQEKPNWQQWWELFF